MFLAQIICYRKPRYLYKNKPDIIENAWYIVLVNRLIRFGLFCLGLTSIELKGKVPIDFDSDQPWIENTVVCGPHSGTFDWSIVVARACRLFSPVIKSEIGDAGALGTLIRLTMPVMVKRDSKKSRSECVEDSKRRCEEGFFGGGKWFPLLAFPEGTNGNRKQFLRFKAGAFIPGKPVQPVLINYPFDEDEYSNDLISWPHFGRSIPRTLLMCMCRLQTTITYTFLDVYKPTSEEQSNPALYAENVRQLMAKKHSKNKNFKVTDWSFEDAVLMRHAVKNDLVAEVGGIKIARVFAGVPNSLTVAKELLEKYAAVVKDIRAKQEDGFQIWQHGSEAGVLPEIEKNLLLKKLYGKNWENEVPDLFLKLPNYVSFEQLCVVHAKILTQKVL